MAKHMNTASQAAPGWLSRVARRAINNTAMPIRNIEGRRYAASENPKQLFGRARQGVVDGHRNLRCDGQRGIAGPPDHKGRAHLVGLKLPVSSITQRRMTQAVSNNSRNRLDCSHFRRLMEDDPKSPRHRQTIRGVGILSRPDSEPEAASELRANGQLQRSRRSR